MPGRRRMDFDRELTQQLESTGRIRRDDIRQVHYIGDVLRRRHRRRLHRMFDHFEEQIGLAVEVFVDRPGGNAARRRDRRHRNAVETVLGKQPLRRTQNASPGGVLSGEAHRCRHAVSLFLHFETQNNTQSVDR